MANWMIYNTVLENKKEESRMDKELWEKAVAFHGHECPGLAIGFKACEAAMEKMGIGISDDEEIVCVTENDACGVDAVQAILSCTMGKGNLIYHGTGKQAFSFFDRKNNKKMRVCLNAKNNDGLDRSKWQEYLLNAPVDEIFTFLEPKFVLPEKARLFTTVVCEICGEGAPEHKMHLQDGKKVCADCFKNYSRGW
jgi:formylmethanofuran dehydrogenase subunit E